MQEIQYESPRSIDEAVRLLADGAHASRVLAGGTDLLVQMREAPPRAERIVDVKAIPELGRLEHGADGLFLGAAVSCWEICENAALRAQYPGLVEAAELIGSMQIQGRATVGGNLCNASPAADTVPALIALGAEVEIAGPGGRRTLPASAFVTGPGQTALAPGEFVVGLRVAPHPPRTRDAYLRFIPRGEMDIAVAGAGVCLTLDEGGMCTAARVALGAVGPTPIEVPAAADALVGTTVTDDALARAGEAASAAARPIDDKRGTATYRRRIAGVLTRRAGALAATRARES